MVKDGTVDVRILVISYSQQGTLEECRPLLAFFLALPPDLLTGSLSFLDFPASFFLSCFGGCENKDTRQHWLLRPMAVDNGAVDA